MKRLVIGILGCLLIWMPLSAAMGEATLISVKQGEDGSRSWVVFTFDQRVDWNGLSRTQPGMVSLYVMGRPGMLEGKDYGTSDPLGPTVSVRRIENQTNVFGIDCVFDAGATMAVVRRPRHLVVSFNDDRFLQQAFPEDAVDVSATPGIVTAFDSEHKNGQVTHALKFDGSFDWVGYVQPAGHVGAFFVDGANIGVTQTERFVSESDLSKMQLFPVNGRRALKAVFFFEPQASYSMVRTAHELLLQTTSRPIQQTLAMVEQNRPQMDISLFQETETKSENKSKPAEGGDSLDELLNLSGDAPKTQTAKPAAEQPAIQKKVEKNNQTETLPAGRTSVQAPVKKETAAVKEDKTQDDEWGRLKSFRQTVEATPDAPTVKTSSSVQPPAGTNAAQRALEQPDWNIPWATVVSFRFDGTPLKDALRTVSRAMQLNMVIGNGVEGNVTMNLQRVTLRQTLNMLVYTNDCEYVVDEGIITIKTVKKEYTGGMVTEIFRLKYAEADNVAPIVKQIVADDSLVQVYHPEFLNHETGGKNRQSENKVDIKGVRRSSVLVVTGRPEDMREVVRVIAELDQAPRQIMIHSKLVEMSPENNQEMGINWDKTITMALNQVDILEGGDKQNYSALNTSPGDGGSMNLGHLTASKFAAVIDFLQEQTETKLKSNPTLMATDNHESSISVGTTVPVPKIQRGFGGQQDMVTFDYKEVNIQLNVTPHINEDKQITMFVNPVIEEISGWVEYEGNQAPITDKRAVNSIVTVRDGETVVIGGLVKTQKVKTLKKVWLLGSVPLIGKLFQHEAIVEKQSDLMIFITPNIVEEGR